MCIEKECAFIFLEIKASLYILSLLSFSLVELSRDNKMVLKSSTYIVAIMSIFKFISSFRYSLVHHWVPRS